MHHSCRPVFKKIHFAHRIRPNVVRAGDFYPNRTVEIDDEDGAVSKLIELMDGSRTVDELFVEMNRQYPELQRDELETSIADLDRLGFVGDQAWLEETSLTGTELARFKANLNFFSYYADLETSAWSIQERMKEARVTIIGVGAFGSTLLFNLAGLGVSSVRIVDFDNVDLSNLNRQMLFNEQDIGRPKVDVARDFMAKFYSNMQVETIQAEIRSAADAERVVEHSDIVVLAADQPLYLIQRWINQACVRLNIPYIAGGNNVSGGALFTIVPGETGCIDCVHLLQSERNAEYVTLVSNLLQAQYAIPNAATAYSLMIICGMMAAEIVRYLTGIGPLATKGKMLTFDFMTFQTSAFLDFSARHGQCPTCGQGTGGERIFQVLAEAEQSHLVS